MKKITCMVDETDYLKLRSKLMYNGQNVSQWLRDKILAEIKFISPEETIVDKIIKSPDSTKFMKMANKVAYSSGVTTCKHGALPHLCRFAECRKT